MPKATPGNVDMVAQGEYSSKWRREELAQTRGAADSVLEMDDGAGRQPWGVNMKRRFPFGMIAAAALLAVSVAQPALAQSTTPSKPVGCNLAWCPIQVEVVKNSSGAEALRVSFDEIRMAPKHSGATLIWKLMGSPDYEFRADSVTAKGANAPWAATQFPLRLVSANEYAYDNLNNSGMTYGYEVRVYKKGSPAGSTPIVSNGTVVNAN